MNKLIIVTIFLPITLARCVHDAAKAASWAWRTEYRVLKRLLKGY